MIKFILYFLIVLSTGVYIKGYFIQNSIEKLSLRINNFESSVNRIYSHLQHNSSNCKSLKSNSSNNSYSIFGKSGRDISLNDNFALVLYEKILNNFIKNKILGLILFQSTYISKNSISKKEYDSVCKHIRMEEFIPIDKIINSIGENLEGGSEEIKFLKRRLIGTLLECNNALVKPLMNINTVREVVDIWIKTNIGVLNKSKNRNLMEIYYYQLSISLYVMAIVKKLVT